MADRTYTMEEIRDMAAALGVTQKHDPASTTPTAPTLHGVFHGNEAQLGLFYNPGVRPERFSALTRHQTGLLSVIAMLQSRFHKERREIMSGVTAAGGTNATSFCGNPPSVGQGKVCEINYEWGDHYGKTDLNVVPFIGQQKDFADVPATILNSPPQRYPTIPETMWRVDDTFSQLQYQLYLWGVAKERADELVLWRGDSTLSSTNTRWGYISEPDGLDRLIKTGYSDAKTGLACGAADSAVINFNAEIDGTMSDGRTFPQAMLEMWYGLNMRSEDMGLGGTIWALNIRKEMWRPLVDVWACTYATYLCSGSTSSDPVNRNLEEINRLRLEFLGGQYLLMEGTPVPVILTEGILREGVGANHYKSDSYFVPISWNGVPLVHFDYFPMDNQYISEWNAFSGSEREVINNGMYLTSKRDTGMCDELHFASRWRMILETPFLAGRLDDVRYKFRAPIRNADPSDTWFYADGGATYRS